LPFILFCDAVVILVPTRELALQTSQVCKELGKHLQIQVMVTTGGTSLKDDIMRLYQPVHLLVGTPGRILDLAKKGVCVLKDCSMLVMDEVMTVPLNFTKGLANTCVHESKSIYFILRSLTFSPRAHVSIFHLLIYIAFCRGALLTVLDDIVLWKRT
jgi:ERCC4-related helicase